ncbi:helix-turn-helix domain-containing protein [Hazenella coriacea]|uniref:Helix-turn-helix protein n=1 Tax=Hazenella coriacea TaxID=1179467 RepID=A0A4R3L833_9BACL|nr:XRE family transcriptional regulator [Hazenella coriacea]TCS95953.1 helix-turn-helix protein [Hazenella coriacea]
MIKTEQEYKKCKKEIENHEKILNEQREVLKQMGLTADQIELGLAPARHFQQRMVSEVTEYERYKSGEFDMTCTFDKIGKQLIAFRIFRGFSQAELAKRLGVTQPQISRDERHEYSGASMEKIRQVLEALEIQLQIIPAEVQKISG